MLTVLASLRGDVSLRSPESNLASFVAAELRHLTAAAELRPNDLIELLALATARLCQNAHKGVGSETRCMRFDVPFTYGLRFADERLERQYVAGRFEASYSMMIPALGFIVYGQACASLFVGILLDPGFALVIGISCTVHMILLFASWRIAKMKDQYVAMVTFSRIYSAIIVGTSVLISVGQHLYHLMVDLSVSELMLIATFLAVATLFDAYYAFSCEHAAFRLLVFSIHFATYDPAITKHGRALGAMIPIGGVVLGTVLGMAFNRRQRLEFRMGLAEADVPGARAPAASSPGQASGQRPHSDVERRGERLGAPRSTEGEVSAQAHSSSIKIQLGSACFADKQLELSFRAAHFRGSFVVLSCAYLFIAMLMAVAAWESEPQSRPHKIVTCVVACMLLAMRIGVHLMADQQDAVIRFSLIWCVVVVLTASMQTAAQWYYGLCLMTTLDDALAYAPAVLLFKLYEAYCMMLPSHSALCSVAIAAHLVAVPVLNARVHASPLIFVAAPLSALVLGELLGQTIKHHLRRVMLQKQLMDGVQTHSRLVREEALRLSEESRLAILEMELKHAKQNQMADSRLNHLIKGTCGTARMCMDLVHRQCRTVLPPQHALLFEQATLALEQAGQWCHMRELFLALDRNEYQTALTHCRPREWLAQLVIADGYLEDGFERSGSGDGHGESTSEAQPSAQHDAPQDHAGQSIPLPARLRIDQSIASIALAEALSNARKYGKPGAPVVLRTRIELATSAATGDGAGAAAEAAAAFTARSQHVPAEAAAAAPSIADLSASASAKLQRSSSASALHIEVVNTDRAEASALTEEECVRAFKAGYRSRQASMTSDGLGLSSVMQAATAANGRAWLRSERQANGEVHTIFHLVLPVELIEDDVDADHIDTVHADTDSPRQHCPHNALSSRPPQASLKVPDGAPSGLVCIGIDDDELSRTLLSAMFEHVLHANMSRSALLGSTPAECASFVDLALGLVDREMRPLALADGGRPADLAVLDQNIFAGATCIHGSDLAASLRARGFDGVVCILTGSSAVKVEELSENGHVDVVASKGISVTDLAGKLLAALALRTARKI